MTKIEMLERLVAQNGDCSGVSCSHCPLNTVTQRGFQNNCIVWDLVCGWGLNGSNYEMCLRIAKQMLSQIAEDTLLGDSR